MFSFGCIIPHFLFMDHPLMNTLTFCLKLLVKTCFSLLSIGSILCMQPSCASVRPISESSRSETNHLRNIKKSSACWVFKQNDTLQTDSSIKLTLPPLVPWIYKNKNLCELFRGFGRNIWVIVSVNKLFLAEYANACHLCFGFVFLILQKVFSSDGEEVNLLPKALVKICFFSLLSLNIYH